MSNKIILVDMDGVIADIEQGFLDCWRAQHPKEQYVPLEKRNGFYLEQQYKQLSPEYEQLALDIFSQEGFYRSLRIIPGSLEALEEMRKLELNPFICTSPFSTSRTCVQEKHDWIQDYLGNEWLKRLIIARDKTLICGDKLIDDKPEITGAMTPSWEHLLFDACHNKDVTNKTRINWNNWKEVLGL